VTHDRADAPDDGSSELTMDRGDDKRRAPWKVEGLDEPNRRGRFRFTGSPMKRRTFWIILGVLLLVNWIVARAVLLPPPDLQVPYSVFLDEVEAGNVAAVTSRGEAIEGTFTSAVTYPQAPDPDAATAIEFETERPAFASEDGLLELLRRSDVTIEATPIDPPRPFWQLVVFGFGPTLIFVGLFVLVLRRFSGGGGLGGLGRSKAKRYEHSPTERVTFADVAGIDEAKAELAELVDFLRRPEKYARLGGRIPSGVLLSGSPGTGKTLLARAVAGEADVPFFSSSASEFVEMVVGVGASRVRDLFAEALKVAPSIIFIDELDAIGRARGAGPSVGGHDEREQTLNQILTEMDGFSGAEGVIVLAATNRPEILDQALLRPGRFDRQVVVNAPDQAGRHAILEIHSRGVPLGSDADLAALASSTPGMVGADLRNLINEAALSAARHDRPEVTMADMTGSLDKILLGLERLIVIDEDERRRTAFHEAGHALLGMLQPGADPVRKISIIPRGRSLGVTLQSPDADRYAYDASYLRGRIIGALGGRAAEEIVFGSVTTGAESDLEQVTRIGRSMVGRWGMSEKVGLITALPTEAQAAYGMSASEATLQLVDSEVRRIVDECYQVAVQTLVAHRDQLDVLAAALLEHETLDEVDAYAAAGVSRTSREPVRPAPFDYEAAMLNQTMTTDPGQDA
jgi:cell division protease FtsH